MSEGVAEADTVDHGKALEMSAGWIETILRETGQDRNPVILGMMDGLTAAQAMGLTRDDLDAMYAVGFHRLNAGDFKDARDMFGHLVMIDPLHAPNHYCLGVALQAMGRVADAEKEFINFLALDATNPAGYLRYGECCQHRGAHGLAKEAFELAEAECRNGHGDAAMMEEARAKLALLGEVTKV